MDVIYGSKQKIDRAVAGYIWGPSGWRSFSWCLRWAQFSRPMHVTGRARRTCPAIPHHHPGKVQPPGIYIG